MSKLHILGISGSLRAASSNTALLQLTAGALDGKATMRLFEGLGSVPPFNPDFDESAPDHVRSFRAMIAATDAVAISSPEYAHGVPGVLKNALDWLVGSGELYRKPVVLLHPSARGEFARASLREILITMGAELILDVVVQSKADDRQSPSPSDVASIAQTMLDLIEKQRGRAGSDPLGTR